MDPKTQMPDIKAEVLKTDDGKKKGAGLFGLFGGGSGGAAGGLGGLGAGAAGGGGLLATKAGMLALVLMGSAVAGGIGLAGYKMFGPGDADKTGGNLSLFAPKPQAAATDGVAPVSADGASASLNMMAQGAAKDKEPEAASASAAAPTDKTAGDPAKDAAAADAARRAAEARAAGGGAINSGGGAGAVGSMNRGLANVKKLGALSGAVGGGATTSAGSGTAGKLGDGMANASRNGASTGFSRGGPGAKASNAKGVAARGGRGARAQARAVMGDQSNGRAGSSFAAGRTYDGSATQSGGAIGPDGGAIGMDGADTGAGAQPKSLAQNSTKDTHEQEPPIPPGKHTVTPWEKALNNAMMAVALAGALMLAATMLLKDVTPLTKAWTITLAKVLLGLAVAAAAVALFYAGQATFGPGGQKTQGGLIMLAATMAGGLSAYMLTQIWSMDASSDAKAAELSKCMTGSDMLIKVIGGGAAVALIGSMMIPKKSMDESEAKAKGYPTSYHAPAPQQDYRV